MAKKVTSTDNTADTRKSDSKPPKLTKKATKTTAATKGKHFAAKSGMIRQSTSRGIFKSSK